VILKSSMLPLLQALIANTLTAVYLGSMKLMILNSFLVIIMIRIIIIRTLISADTVVRMHNCDDSVHHLYVAAIRVISMM